ncbi:hypothetical protein BYT27DRAFT_7209245 [Phlegmacium glaucopus]|nr:hypothetical protein BYT27DRAFT_7209245 [Phlegmacium glaucopus]
MPSQSPIPTTSHSVGVVQVILSFHAPKPAAKKDSSKGGKKSTAPKGKVEMKTKEISFTFEASEDNYLSFLSELLKAHSHNNIKVLLGKKMKKDGVDIDMFAEYEKITKKILEEEPSKLTVYLDLEDVKASAKQHDEGNSTSSDDGSSDEEGANNGKSGIERELGRIRGVLEKKYANPADSGYTYVALTPSMMSEWARAIYDMDASANHPPNTLSFDPKTRTRSLFHNPKPLTGSASTGGADMLHVFSSILSDARALFVPNIPTTPSNSTVSLANPPSALTSAISISPAKNTPTKLSHFLRYVEEHEGIKDAQMFEDVLSEKGYGPDVMGDITKDDLVSCGLTAGDALHMKRAACIWWTSPDAKRTRHSPTPTHSVHIDDCDHIRFEKRYANNTGCKSVFGPGIIPGRNLRAKEFQWTLEKVPDGFIPDIDPEYINLNAPLFEPSPSPELTTHTD